MNTLRLAAWARLACASWSSMCCPNAISPLIAQIVSSVAGEITMISTLSYIGLGVQQPAPEWGSMLAAGQQFMRDPALSDHFSRVLPL